MRSLILGAWALIFCGVATAQTPGSDPHVDRGTGYDGPVVFRSEFVSYDIRDSAEAGDLAKNQHYFPLKLVHADSRYNAGVDLPVSWLEREIFLQVEGVQAFYLFINGQRVGYAEDSRTPVQFDITSAVTTGPNDIVISPVSGSGTELESALTTATQPQVFIFTQPKLRIHDYTMRFEPDPESGRFGFIELCLTVANNYNYEETIHVGYDVYSPQGTLLHYDFREIKLAGNSSDTLMFREPIWRANDNFWSAADPKLHYGQLSVRRDARMIEYIPYKIGYGITRLEGGRVVRNGEAVNVSAVRYNSAASRKETSPQISALKKQGYNTICPDYPQPVWFYDLCDELGMYVIDRVNLNSAHGNGDRKLGGSYANDPAWLGSFEARTQAAYERVKNRTCIVARSLGADMGNGYNMYRTYLQLKGLAPNGIVVYDGAAGEWNSDLPPVQTSAK